MAKETEIAWTHSTFNGWWGCQKAGPGCDNCYAEALDARTGGAHWGPGAPRRRTGVKNWNDPIRWNAKHEEFFALRGCRRRVFTASMSDVFDNAVPLQWRHDLWDLMESTAQLDWLVLTKRIGNVASWVAARGLPSHVMLGATVVSQEEANRDIPKLQAVKEAKRFLSMEPLLGPVDLTGLLGGIDWVIVGGESGGGARPMHPDWVRALRDQCQAAGVPFLFKQWGEWRPMQLDEVPLIKGRNCRLVSNGSRPTLGDGAFHMAHQLRAMVTDPAYSWQYPVLRVGKAKAGRLLDGVLHDNFPA